MARSSTTDPAAVRGHIAAVEDDFDLVVVLER